MEVLDLFILFLLVGKQVSAGDVDIVGVMVESHLMEGNQKLDTGKT